MYKSGLVNTLGTHANTKGFGLTFLSGVRRGFMPPQLKTKQTHWISESKNLKEGDTLLVFVDTPY